MRPASAPGCPVLVRLPRAAPRCRNRAARDHPCPHPSAAARPPAAAQPPPPGTSSRAFRLRSRSAGFLGACACALHPSISDGVYSSLGRAGCQLRGLGLEEYRVGVGQSPAKVGLARAGPGTMVSGQPASSGHLSPATWTSGQPQKRLLLREASCPHLPTMLCLPIGQAASSLGRCGGGDGGRGRCCFPYLGLQPERKTGKGANAHDGLCSCPLALEERFVARIS